MDSRSIKLIVFHTFSVQIKLPRRSATKSGRTSAQRGRFTVADQRITRGQSSDSSESDVD
jgi:hypothetical protein